MEALEHRLQLSSASFVDGQLSIEVTGNDRVQVTASHGQTVVKFNGQAANLGTVPASQVSAIVAGNDTIWGSAFHDLLNGGMGNDYLLGRNGEDILLGGGGNDRLNGGANSDSLEGGDGQDILIGQAGDDSLFGNADFDRLSGDNGIDWLEGGAGRDATRRQNKITRLIGDDLCHRHGEHGGEHQHPKLQMTL